MDTPLTLTCEVNACVRAQAYSKQNGKIKSEPLDSRGGTASAITAVYRSTRGLGPQCATWI